VDKNANITVKTIDSIDISSQNLLAHRFEYEDAGVIFNIIGGNPGILMRRAPLSECKTVYTIE
jgi:hypothetical protein